MIQTTQLPSIPAADSSAILKRNAENTESEQGFQDILGQSTNEEAIATSPVANDSATGGTDKSKLAPYLYELLGSTNPTSLNEEQLFAGVVHERLVAAKGQEAADAYDAALEKQLSAQGHTDGFVFLEDAARAALSDLEQQGVLTMEEAETIHAQAFQAAQLDANKNALYDSFGTTRSVASTETALESALATLLKFDSGELESGRMSLSFRQGQQAVTPAGIPASQAVDGTVSTTGSGTDGTVLSGTPVDSLSGFRWNPVSTNVGKLAVLLPAQLQDVNQMYITDSQGNTVEKAFYAGEDKGRLVYRFNEQGGAYPTPSIVHVEMGDGTLYQFEVNTPGSVTTDVRPYAS